MKHLKSINESISGTISTNNLYVVKTYINIEIMTVYASKRTAQKEKDRLDKEATDYYKKNYNTKDPHDTLELFIERNAPKYRVISLYDAIEEIKDYIKEETEEGFHSHGYSSY